jgi:hypothetical protein
MDVIENDMNVPINRARFCTIILKVRWKINLGFTWFMKNKIRLGLGFGALP